MRLLHVPFLAAILVYSSSVVAQTNPADTLVAINLSQVNTDANEFWPLLSNDGKTFYFMRTLPLRRVTVVKLYQCPVQADGYFGEPTEVERFSHLEYFGGITIDDAGEMFLSYNPPNASSRDIYQLKGNDLVVLDHVNTTKWYEGSPCVSADGLSLFFVSNRDVIGTGDYHARGGDIYVSHRSSIGGQWSDPLKLGKQINMGQYNSSPYISRDGKYLFFSANPEHDWMRIYVATRTGELDTAWSKAVLLPEVINGGRNSEFPMLSASAKEFFFVTDRKGGKGQQDIYQVHLPNGIESLIGKR